jgi:hypothetical protein
VARPVVRTVKPLIARLPLFHALLSLQRRPEWSIGIYQGPSPTSLSPAHDHNPVLTRRDVSDARATFVADPFMVERDGRWYLFFEFTNFARSRGEIGLAASADGRRWHYQQRVLAEPFHLSYPQVFEADGSFFMVPETHQAGEVRLYEARPFPHTWVHEATLLRDAPFADPTLFRSGSGWWLFTTANPPRWDDLRLFHATDLRGPWQEHPRSPVVAGDAQRARPAGRVVVHGGRVIRFAQDTRSRYGERVSALEITTLTASDYHEQALGRVLSPGDQSWNAVGMHHLDAHLLADGTWVACVDGQGRRRLGLHTRAVPSHGS